MIASTHIAGRLIAKALGTGPSRSTLAAQRDGVIRAMREAAQPKAFPVWKLSGALAVAAIAISVVFVATRETELSASFAGKKLEANAQIQASRGEAVEFSDGSRLALDPHARIGLADFSSNKASVVLNDGRLAASIRKGTGRTWTVSAGPFAVRVVGTEFTVRWDPVQQAFAISVTEGKVVVSGGDLPAHGVALEAGGRLERRLGSASGGEPGGPSSGPPAEEAQIEQAPSDAVGKGALNRASEPTWDSLANAAKYKRALELAERAGFERLAAELAQNDLLLLANTARYAGDSKRARLALLKLRQRFPGGAATALAALHLAGIAEDHDKDPVEAANWLSVFLNEAPRGELAAGARARLLAILVRQGNQARARQIAADYLKYHPGGPHAEKARSIVESSPK